MNTKASITARGGMKSIESNAYRKNTQVWDVPAWSNGASRMNHGVGTEPESEAGRVTEREYRRITEFLYHEAQLLDQARWDEWLALLTEDVYYRVVAAPLRLLENDTEEQHEVMLFDDDKHTLGKWIVHLRRTASADNPPFARHFITNIQVTYNAEEGHFEVCSALLLSCSRSIQLPPFLFTAKRHDVLCSDSHELRLARRLALLD